MHQLKATISARLYDPHGKLIRKFRPRAAHSFLAQFIEYLTCQMSQDLTGMTMTDGEEMSLSVNSANFRLNAPAETETWGMLIGGGTTPVHIDDYALETPITADITMSAHTFILSYATPTTRRIAISRIFTNTSVSPIQIEEVALYTMDASVHITCLDRTLYSIGIPGSSALELTYRIQV